MIVGFLLCSLKFQSFKIGPIYGKNLDEIKAIIELTKFKVKEHKFKNENPNLRKGLGLKSNLADFPNEYYLQPWKKGS